jgi:hypothetical protein
MLQSAPAVGGPSARLYLDEIGAPVVARITHLGPDRMTVRRALPFLKLHSSVHDEGGRRAEVAAVSVVIEDGTPQLVLELTYDDASEAQAAPAEEALPADDQLFTRTAEPIETVSPKSRRDATLSYVIERETPVPAAPARPPARPREATLQFVTVRAALKDGEPALMVPQPSLWSLATRFLSRVAAACVRRLLRAPAH